MYKIFVFVFHVTTADHFDQLIEPFGYARRVFTVQNLVETSLPEELNSRVSGQLLSENQNRILFDRRVFECCKTKTKATHRPITEDMGYLVSQLTSK